jgi:hypothetical protein
MKTGLNRPTKAQLCYVNSDTLDHGLANCSTLTTTGTRAIVYWYEALIKVKHKQDRQCTDNVTLKCVRATIVAVEKQ